MKKNGHWNLEIEEKHKNKKKFKNSRELYYSKCFEFEGKQ